MSKSESQYESINIFLYSEILIRNDINCNASLILALALALFETIIMSIVLQSLSIRIKAVFPLSLVSIILGFVKADYRYYMFKHILVY